MEKRTTERGKSGADGIIPALRYRDAERKMMVPGEDGGITHDPWA